MTTAKLPLRSLPALPCVILFLLVPFLRAQITVDGKVIDSKSKPVGGVDVGIYVPGAKDPIASQKSSAKGEYSFQGLKLQGAFDIMYTHSMYETATVTRLAESDNQHVSKVIYLKGEPKAVTAVHEQFLSARRLVFLAVAINNKDDQIAFAGRLSKMGVWEGIDRNIDKMSSDKLTAQMRALLDMERSQTLELRKFLP